MYGAYVPVCAVCDVCMVIVCHMLNVTGESDTAYCYHDALLGVIQVSVVRTSVIN
jgi:hypothetical protein